MHDKQLRVISFVYTFYTPLASFNSMSVLNAFVTDSKTCAKLWIELKLSMRERFMIKKRRASRGEMFTYIFVISSHFSRVKLKVKNRPMGLPANVLITSSASCVRNPVVGFKHISSILHNKQMNVHQNEPESSRIIKTIQPGYNPRFLSATQRRKKSSLFTCHITVPETLERKIPFHLTTVTYGRASDDSFQHGRNDPVQNLRPGSSRVC